MPGFLPSEGMITGKSPRDISGMMSFLPVNGLVVQTELPATHMGLKECRRGRYMEWAVRRCKRMMIEDRKDIFDYGFTGGSRTQEWAKMYGARARRTGTRRCRLGAAGMVPRAARQARAEAREGEEAGRCAGDVDEFQVAACWYQHFQWRRKNIDRQAELAPAHRLATHPRRRLHHQKQVPRHITIIGRDYLSQGIYSTTKTQKYANASQPQTWMAWKV